MGQTLTHGVYLPDEGERNCYNGLAANWQILDNSVGTIAEHTSALAGKAPLVHTHTKADITDFPVYGTTAGTICEGNDSRLSDARTPVAHTHTKSDVTDLLNSDFIPSANNSYDLGSSSYQWNNLYAKNYYYNGTQWGLDQANTWTGTQTYRAYLKSFGEARTDEWSSNSRTNAYLLSRRDTDDVSGFLISTFRQNAAQGTARHVYGWDILDNSTRYSGLRFTIDWDSTLNSGNGAYRVTLGTNTQGTNPCNDLHITQLKTINGINPGALSIPDYDETKAISVDTTGWTYDGSTANQLKINNATQTINGWLFIRIENVASTDRVIIRFNGNQASDPAMGFSPASTDINLIMPIPANKITNIYLTKSPSRIKFYPCLGNV